MAWPAQRPQPSTADGWVALGWSVAALLAVGLFGAFALPGTTPSPFDDYQRSDFLRPEWLVLATLLAYPVFLAARASWWVALPVVAVLSAQSWYVVDTALGSLHQAGIATATGDAVLYGVVVAQVVAFSVAGCLGSWRCLERRRWLRRMRRLMPELASAPVVDADASPSWDEGFFSTG